MSQFSLTPAWVLITGASAGIGEVFARRFAEQGNRLILVARSADKLKALADQLELIHNNRVMTITLDLTERAASKKICDEISRQGVNLYGLVNNAGCGAEGLYVQVERERYLHMIDL